MCMNKANSAVRKMSDMVIFCELRQIMADIACNARHGMQPSKPQSDYGAALMAEQARRGGK